MLFGWIKKLWRSRGFGVHSPFAYRFITRVLREKGVYYCYPSLKQISVDGREYRDFKLLFRLICDFSPDHVCIAIGEGDDEAERAVVAAADSRIKITSVERFTEETERSDRPLIYIRKDHPEASGLMKAVLRRGGMLVLRNFSGSVVPEIRDAQKGVMTFSNGAMTVIVSRPDLPRQDFEIYF